MDWSLWLALACLRLLLACLDLSGPAWACLGLPGPVWACLGLSGLAWACLGLPGPVWACLCFSRTAIPGRLVFLQNSDSWKLGVCAQQRFLEA